MFGTEKTNIKAQCTNCHSNASSSGNTIISKLPVDKSFRKLASLRHADNTKSPEKQCINCHSNASSSGNAIISKLPVDKSFRELASLRHADNTKSPGNFEMSISNDLMLPAVTIGTLHQVKCADQEIECVDNDYNTETKTLNIYNII